MKNRFLTCAAIVILAITPALADTNSTTTVNPSNNLSVNPTTNQAASTANISTQINNQNLGANSYGGGISCQSPQVAVGGYGANETSSVGLNNSDTGFSVQYLAPLGGDSNKTCAALSHEVLTAHQLDNTLVTIQKCADFARAGVVLNPAVYPELAHACAGVHVSASSQAPLPPLPVSANGTNGQATASR